MIMFSLYLVAALVAAATALPQQVPSTSEERISPCPDLFSYESVDQPGQWTGNILIRSEDELHGVWARLIFDNPIKKISVDGDYEADSITTDNQVLIKNKDVLLKAGSPINIRVTVKYGDNKFPQLIEYRLNAKTLCPALNTIRTDFFQGDENSKDLLTDILSPVDSLVDQSAYECGVRSSTNSPTYPWVADIFLHGKNTETYICEATLVSPSQLITAAHCVTFKNDKMKIPVARLAVTMVESGEQIKTRTVSQIKIHPAYDPNTLFNDIAVIELVTPFDITDNIRPICLNQKGNLDSTSLIGYEIERSGEISSQQKETSVLKIDASECRKKAPQLENILGEDSYCLTYLSGNSLCTGDSGSGLVTLENNVATLRGIVRVGVLLQNKTQCDDGSVVLVTSIEKHLKWISQALK